MIHTDGICDVYNVPAVHLASSGMSDTHKYSVIFQDTSFDDHEYMFTNDLGMVDDLTMDTFLRKVSRSVLESSAYDLSDAEFPQIPVPPSSIPILDIGYISSDPDDVRCCTRQLKLYYRVAMEVQDVDAQPLYYGNKPRPGGVEVTSTQWSRCHVYRGESTSTPR